MIVPDLNTMDQELVPIVAKADGPGIEAMIQLANERVRQEQAKIQAQKREIRLEKGRKRQAKYAKKKQTEASGTPMETYDVPTMSMDTMSDCHDEHGEEEPQKQRMLPKKVSSFEAEQASQTRVVYYGEPQSTCTTEH